MYRTYFLNVLKYKFSAFEGRASRPEFWYFVLFNFLTSIAVVIVDILLGGTGFPSRLYVFVMAVPSVSISIRRLHDIGRSIWWYFLFILFPIGTIWLIVLFCKPGVFGFNEYGPDPNSSSVL